jgi:hypothetical protein
MIQHHRAVVLSVAPSVVWVFFVAVHPVGVAPSPQPKADHRDSNRKQDKVGRERNRPHLVDLSGKDEQYAKKRKGSTCKNFAI